MVKLISLRLSKKHNHKPTCRQSNLKSSMSSFDPDFNFFRSSRPYRNKSTDHESKFMAFRSFALEGQSPSNIEDVFVIQFVCHPNFMTHSKTVTYFLHNGSGEFDRTDDLPAGFRRANSYKNYKSDKGHKKGLFYELNLYTPSGSSAHHTSRVKGSAYARDDSHDQRPGFTKGPHW